MTLDASDQLPVGTSAPMGAACGTADRPFSQPSAGSGRLLFLTAALAAPAADSTNSAPDTLLLRNGDSLDGHLLSIDPHHVVRWKNPDVAEPIEFKLEGVSQLDLHPPAPPDRGTNYPCKVFLTQGDVLEGSLVSCTRGHPLPPDLVCRSIKNSAQTRPVHLLLPSHARSLHRRRAGGLDQGRGGGVLGAEAGRWTFRDGAFYADKSASIARDLKLPDTADLQFDLAWSGTLTFPSPSIPIRSSPCSSPTRIRARISAPFTACAFKVCMLTWPGSRRMENPHDLPCPRGRPRLFPNQPRPH